MNLEKMVHEDPESSAFYNARKNSMGSKRGVNLPQITKKTKKIPFKL